MIPALLVRIAAGFGVGERFQKVAGAALGILGLAVAAGLLWLCVHLWFGHHDRTVINEDRAVSNAEVRNTQIEAERAAGADKAARDAQFTTNQSDIKEATDAAADNGDSPLDALFNRLR